MFKVNKPINSKAEATNKQNKTKNKKKIQVANSVQSKSSANILNIRKLLPIFIDKIETETLNIIELREPTKISNEGTFVVILFKDKSKIYIENLRENQHRYTLKDKNNKVIISNTIKLTDKNTYQLA